MFGDGYYNYAKGFGTVHATATSGNDVALLYGTSGDDFLHLAKTEAALETLDYSAIADGFDTVKAFAGEGGTDTLDEQAHDFVLKTIGDWLG